MEIINCKICLTPNTRPRVKFDENKPTMIPKRLINNDKMLKIYPSFKATPISVGIKKTIDWYKIYYKNQTPEEEKTYDNS